MIQFPKKEKSANMSLFFFPCYYSARGKKKIFIYLSYLRSLGSQKSGKAHKGNSYIATSNHETLTDDKRRRIT